MKKNRYVILVYFLLIRQNAEGATARHKYTNRKDVSEYCKRRVLPSVFLGRNVLDANSHVLHFSQLELPYSCSLSVRCLIRNRNTTQAESGSNIILVIQLVSENSLIESCTEENHQLLVYEIGETFGGYWGPLPDSVMRQEVQNFTEFYTLKSTEKTTTADNSSVYKSDEEESEENTESITQKTKITTGDYIEMELPLVNISGNFSLDGVRAEGLDDLLKILNDVTRRDELNYDTTILPLLQFSILTPNDNIYDDLNIAEISTYPRIYTPDRRLNFHTINRRRQFINRRRGFSNKKHGYKPSTSFKVKTHTTKVYQSLRNVSSMFFTYRLPNRRTKTLDMVEPIIKSLGRTTDVFKNTNILNRSELDAHQNVSVHFLPETLTRNNKSLQSYLDRNNITSDFINPETSTKNHRSLHDLSTEREFKRNITSLSTIENHLSTEETTPTEPYLTSVSEKGFAETLSDQHIKRNDSSYSKIVNFNTETTSNGDTAKKVTSPQLQTGSMVNHESWENVVQVAPVMAVLLNQTVTHEYFTTKKKIEKNSTNPIKTVNTFNTSLSVKHRRKRYLELLEIKNAMPRTLTTANQPYIYTGTNDFVAVPDISHLVELKDDEVLGRVSLRYMRNYVGSTLFNICDYTGPKLRHIYLFNTSRIVISITNFTMEQMTLVLTPAKVLKSKETDCPSSHLECQISGARVCIDSMTACDGVPNCGTYDIYDEDRLLCGKVNSMRHNVYLATCTFLAVVLTLLYIVHYWLKRCVPRVSEAFFLYSDRSENILNLETIMQSPHDYDDGSKMVYDGDLFYDESLDIDNEENNKENLFKKLWKFCLVCRFKKFSRDKEINEDNVSQDSNPNHPSAKRLFSFTELELSKITSKRITTDTSIQTGDSLKEVRLGEIKRLTKENKLLLNFREYDKNKKKIDELTILKFLKESRSDSIKSVPVDESFNSIRNRGENRIYSDAVDEERELLNTEYESQGSGVRKHEPKRVVTRAEVHSEKIEPSLQKRLRFDEDTTTIPSIQEEDENFEQGNNSRTQVILGTEKLRNSEIVDDIDDEANGSGKEFIRFWTGTKSKKKKKHVALH